MTRTATEWLKEIDRHKENAGDGIWLEDLVCEIGHRVPDWDLSKVEHFKDWAANNYQLSGGVSMDLGIDCVGTRIDGSRVAIQCKARKHGSELNWKELSTFYGKTSDSDKWKERWVVTNAAYGNKVRAALEQESNPLKWVDFIDPVRSLAEEELDRVPEDQQMTDMQDECVANVVEGLKEWAREGREAWNVGESRGQVILPCGTGKTRIAFRVMKELVSTGEIAIVLVPSIALVSQIKGQFQSLARKHKLNLRTLAVCSDVQAGGSKRSRKTSEDNLNLEKNPATDAGYVRSYEVIGDTATNQRQVIEWLNPDSQPTVAISVLFSTYQSAHNTAAGLREWDLKAKLMICDEAHRTAGIKKIPNENEALRNFTLCHDKDAFPAEFRLYQTATPRIYTKQKLEKNIFDEDDTSWDVRSMNDPDTFGPELFRLSYVEAVKRELLSDYKIVAWGLNAEDEQEAQRIAAELNRLALGADSKMTWTTGSAMRALTLAAFLAGCVPKVEVHSVIAFLNRVKISSELAVAVNSKPVKKWVKKYFSRLELESEPRQFNCTHIDAKHSTNTRKNALRNLGDSTEQNPFCISNVGIFGEGTDSPNLSAVAFLNPRKSPVDVIQAVGRAMRKSPDKSVGYVLVPVIIPAGHDPEHFLQHSDPDNGWSELGQILQALRAHDGRIEDRLEDLISYYAPPPPRVYRNHIVFVKEPHLSVKAYQVRTKAATIEEIVAPNDYNDKQRVRQKLESRAQDTVTEIKDLGTLSKNERPQSITGIRIDREDKTLLKDFTYAVLPASSSVNSKQDLWDPIETDRLVRSFLQKDIQRKNTQMRPVKRRKRSESTVENQLGLKLVKLEGNQLADKGVLINLLEKSGIQSGSNRDVNLLQATVNAVARDLRENDLEDVLATRLGMENVDRSSQGNADACQVTAVIWFNASLLHVRLERAGLGQLKNVPSLETAVSRTTPARGMLSAWLEILKKDYTPIFGIAMQLLQDVAFASLEGVSDALRRLAKDSTNIADSYANMGVDYAGELFNKVMGNQRSDGAFFTRPIAATMLAELALHAKGEIDWLNENNWTKLRTFDPACGSGTLLVAMLNAIKRRIRKAGGSKSTVQKFHRYAVESLFMGADINSVSLQLAGCQLTLGELSSTYEKIPLYEMEYGPQGIGGEVSVGTPEVLLDKRLNSSSSLLEIDVPTGSQQLDLHNNSISTDISDELVENPPDFVLMNPPYTPWRDIGSKFSKPITKKLRKRLSDIWNEVGQYEPLLSNSKSSLASLFEVLATRLIKRSQGVAGLVRAATVLFAEDARSFRKTLASETHIDYVLTSHHPSNFNMSWDTNVHECLIVFSKAKTRENRPTLFINLHKFPESIDQACKTIESAVQGLNFEGNCIEWNYDLVRGGDWSPASFGEAQLSALAHQATCQNPHLRFDLINTGGGGWRATRFDI